MGNLVTTILITTTVSVVSFFLGVAGSDRARSLLSRLKLPVMARHLGLKALTARIKQLTRPLGLALLSALRHLHQQFQIPGQCICSQLAGSEHQNELQAADGSDQELEPAPSQPDLDTFNCRVRVTANENSRPDASTFTAEICGLIDSQDRGGDAALHISIADITEGPDRAAPVYAHGDEHNIEQHPPFRYATDLGKLPPGPTTLSDWTIVARLRCDRLWLPCKGTRLLQFECTVAISGDGCELAHAQSTCAYENNDIGYLDFEQNCQRAVNLGVGLAFAVSASDNKLFNCEIDLIKNWARSHVSLSDQSEKAQRQLEKQLDKTVTFFRRGNHLSTEGVCREIVTIAPAAERYDILELCLRVAQAKGMAAPEELAILSDLASWLEVDSDRFHAMMEKILPVGIHQVQDSITTLGITDEMSHDQIIQHLTREYGKWNSRVTNPDPQVRKQADQMLKLISETREQYAEQAVTA